MPSRRIRTRAELLEPRRLLSATMLADLDPRNLGSAPQQGLVLGSEIFFEATDATHGAELWKTDGTPAGTVLVKDVVPGPTGSFPSALTVYNNALYFIVANQPTGDALWKTDGTADGTTMVSPMSSTFRPTPAGEFQTAVANGRLYFTNPLGPDLTTVWSTDGTAAGTQQVLPDRGGSYFGTVASMTVLDDTVYFSSRVANPPIPSSEGSLYSVADGHTAHLIQYPNDPYSGPASPELTPFGGLLYLISEDFAQTNIDSKNPLYEGVTEVVQLNNIHDLTATSESLFFVADAAPRTPRLFRLEGPAGGAQVVAPLSNPSSLVAMGGELYFTAGDTAHGNELWKTDGTAAGTQLVADLTPGPGDSVLADLTPSAGKLFFSAQTPDGTALWETDGTAAGTVSLPSPPPSGTAGAGSGFIPFGSGVFFAADDGVHGVEPWLTDGTPGGTLPLGDLNLASLATPPLNFTPYRGGAFFTVTDLTNGMTLWWTDGTPAGTRLVIDPSPDPTQTLRDLTVVGGTLYFTRGDDVHGPQLWRSDGTAAGTYAITNLATNGITIPDHITDVNGTLYFTGAGSVWRSDGTAAGTVALCPFPQTLTLSHLTNLDGRLLVDSVGELYALNDAQNALVQLGPGATPVTTVQYQPDELVVGSRMYYINIGQAPDGTTSGPSLYVTDGTPAGTTLIKSFGTSFTSGAHDMAWFDGRLFFAIGAYEAGYGNLWASDGTPAGTVPVSTKNQPGAQSFTIFNGRLYFIGPDNLALLHPALFSTDGTSAGITMVADLDPDGHALNVGDLVAAGGALFFTADNPVGGRDLWISDGTTAGTRRDPQAAGYPLGLSPQEITPAGSHLYFTADDSIHGREPWARELAGTISGSVFNDLNNNGSRDPAEAGLGGVTVYSDANGNGALDPGEISTVTDASGNYTLAGIPANESVLIREILPAGWRRTSPATAGDVLVPITDEALPGPTFGDVQISTVPMDFNYLLTLAQHYGQQGTFATGDLNDDDQVNFNDLLILAQNYGHPLAAAGTGPALGPDALFSTGMRKPRRRGL